ncbi:MAG: hypothetical protein GY719_33065 [bacterium]|nr:hypothetical protein [bacterium]
MARASGLHSLAVSVPDRVLTNDHWRKNHPRLVADAEEDLWMWKQPDSWDEGSEAFNRAMAPYLKDPFRGARERRVLREGGSSLELETQAARRALAAAGTTAEEIGLLICTSFLPDHRGVGGATYLARELGLRGAAWNVESACTSSLISLQTACSLVATGQYEKVLVVTSCTYSRVAPEDDPIAWGIGDAATAMVVGPVDEGIGLLGSHGVHSGETKGAVAYHLELDGDGKPWYRLRTGKIAADVLRDTSESFLQECTGQALAKAGLELQDIDQFVFNTPLAWYASFCARSLGVDQQQTLSVYPFYANVGPALLGLNLFHAAHWKRFEPGELVLLYSVGSVSSCSAAVVRWGEVALGEVPADTSLERLREIEADTLASYRLGRIDDEVLTPAQRTPEPDRRLHRLVRRYVELAIDEPGIMQLFSRQQQDELWSLPVRARAERFLGTLEKDIGEIFRKQDRAPEVDPMVAAQSLLGIIHWGVTSHRAEGRLSRDEAVEQVAYLALHGLVARPPSYADQVADA